MSGPVTKAVSLADEVRDLKEQVRIKDAKIAMLERESAVLFQREVNSWQDEVFTRATPASIMAHLKREVEELGEDYGEEEAADVYILLLALAGKCGYNLHVAASVKMLVNKDREWGEPDAEGVVEHVRESTT